MTQETDIILSQAAAAFRARKLHDSIRILQTALDAGLQDTRLYNALAISYQRAHDFSAMSDLLDDALKFDPKNLKGWILKGANDEHFSRHRAALQAYNNAQNLAKQSPPQSPALERDVEQLSRRIPPLVKALERETYAAFDTHLESSDEKDQRFKDTLDILFGKKEIYYQNPHQLYVPDLPQKQFYVPRDFDWKDPFEAKFSSIRDEAKHLLMNPELFSPYLESTFKDGRRNSDVKSHMAMVDNPDWSAFYLIRDGAEVEGARDLCPNAFEALDRVDLCKTEGGTPSVLFSLLKPGAHIPPHTGMLNCRLICHLPLIIPEKCGIRVGNRTVEWEEGKLIIFDDSIEHEAWNKSGSDRIILLFDIWRPEISPREKTLISELLKLSNQ